ncbi:hypothetical protein MBLNU230_g2796t1 [Neophaeotheca triangularis]
MGNQNVITCTPPAVEQFEAHGYLFGYPISHSWSPQLHNTIYSTLNLNWRYHLLESTDKAQFLQLIRHPKCYGSAVTMPFKVDILQHLDEVTDEGRGVGACNTIFKRRGKLIGTNTDVVGVRESFVQNVVDPATTYRGRPGLVAGGGGAARSAVYALKKFLGCETIYLVNRDVSEVESVVSWCRSVGYGDGLIRVSTPSQAERLEGPGAIVACVPDIAPATELEKEARRVLEVFLAKPHKGAMLEMCYHPSPYTGIAALAESAGWQVILGTEAMIYQGIEQDALWLDKSLDQLPVAEVKAAIRQELEKAQAMRN